MNSKDRIDATSSQGTVSKYFSRNIDADESSDFQECKYSFKRPEVQKPKVKSKPKHRKRGKGQKDIRSALKGGKSNLYPEDFKKACCQSGIDVDSEQLQIAIAISESLKNVKENSDEVSQSESLVERCKRIKKTLLEYGFKVPDNKKTLVTKRSRGIKKHSKLLHTSDIVRQQLIIDKYSQLLFTFNIPASDTTNNTEITGSHRNYLYSLSTEQPYSFLRDNSIFYVKGLFQESTSDLGNLLKDWSKIPGRAWSPNSKKVVLKPFCTMSLKQEQLDGILSGKMQFSNEILSNVEHSNRDNRSMAELSPNYNSGQTSIKNSEYEEHINDNNYRIVHVPVRSQSPDLFDDMSTILHSSNEEIVLEEKTKVVEDIQTVCHNACSKQELRNIKNDGNNIADSVSYTNTNHSFISNASNHESIPRLQDLDDETINDLTQSSDSDDCSLPYVAVGKYNRDSVVDSSVNVNLVFVDRNNSSSSNSKFNEYIYHHSDHSSVDHNSICISNNVDLVDNEEKYEDEIDLTQSSPDDDKVCVESFRNENSLNGVTAYNNLGSEFIKYNNVDIDVQSDSIDKTVTENFDKSSHNPTNFYRAPENLVPFQSSNIPFESSIGVASNLALHNIDNKGKKCKFEIDLTQSSPDEDLVSVKKSTNITYNTVGNESIDYDVYINNDLNCDKDEIQNLSNSPHKSTSFHSIIEDIASSQSSNVPFEISDEELDYSMNKSKYCKENSFDFDKPTNNENIYNSLTHNFSINNNSKPNNTFNRSFSDSFLPAVNIKGTKFKSTTSVNSSKSQNTTPVKKEINEDISIQTPKASEYTIKTENVTPMLNYETIATPQINKELDKYGLKPFKRKRAVQLLKHLYNQTHPIIEKAVDDLPNKRFKPATVKDIDLEKLTAVCDNIYMCTNEVPVLKEVACDPDEWVFQKKEKSKISSCRVPLHISFHNYVGCRRYLREAILRYEPVSIDVIHKDLVGYGFRYDPKDLLKFMDKKCITVKTADNKKRNKQ